MTRRSQPLAPLPIAHFEHFAGMTWHDAFAETPVYEKAISRLPAEMQVERARRIKRAFDLSQKHAEMPAHMQVRDRVLQALWCSFCTHSLVRPRFHCVVIVRLFLSDCAGGPYARGQVCPRDSGCHAG